ncbi:hypothetical protein DFH06DRAFT_1151583 [Mycena polygramma]|nr:hypothetical protein DFH06DRAFT_1151583 [Mycena polygramma]
MQEWRGPMGKISGVPAHQHLLRLLNLKLEFNVQLKKIYVATSGWPMLDSNERSRGAIVIGAIVAGADRPPLGLLNPAWRLIKELEAHKKKVGFYNPYRSVLESNEHLAEEVIVRRLSILPHWLDTLEKKPPPGYTEYDEDDFLALLLARDFGLSSILPSIFYECCRYDTRVVLSAEISFDDKTKCILAKEEFGLQWSSRLYHFLFHQPPACANRRNCGRLRFELLEERSLLLGGVLRDPLDWTLGLCTECIRHAKNDFEEERSLFWDALPSLFGLAPWQELLSGK